MCGTNGFSSYKDTSRLLDEVEERLSEEVEEDLQLLRDSTRVIQEFDNCRDRFRKYLESKGLYEEYSSFMAEDDMASGSKVSSGQTDVERPKTEHEEEHDTDVKDNKTLQTLTDANLVVEDSTSTALPFAQNQTLLIDTKGQMAPSKKHEKTSEEDLNEWEDAERAVLAMISDREEEIRLHKEDIESAKLGVSTQEQRLEEAKEVLRSAYEREQGMETEIRIMREYLASRCRELARSEKAQQLEKSRQAGRSAHEWMIDMVIEIDTWWEGLHAKRRKVEVPERECEQDETSG